jgi:hypothetical protein
LQQYSGFGRPFSVKCRAESDNGVRVR